MERDPRPSDIFELIYRIAGAVGVDPQGLTLRELLAMHKGKRESLWAVASSQMALLANCHSTKRRWKPEDFNPVVEKAKPQKVMLNPQESVALLKKVFGLA